MEQRAVLSCSVCAGGWCVLSAVDRHCGGTVATGAVKVRVVWCCLSKSEAQLRSAFLARLARGQVGASSGDMAESLR